jgi:hypothetical protein
VTGLRHPTVWGDSLVGILIRGGFEERFSVPLADVRRVVVKAYSQTRTTILMISIPVGILSTIFLSLVMTPI